ncbi:MAG: hypothetical protein MUF36_02555 [Bacteroidales bacterium]|nr:hypothetical protein [Bacteroidales bacterium]
MSKKIIYGGGMILVAVVMIVLSITLHIKFLAGSMIPLLGTGVLFFTPLMGSYNTQIYAANGFLKIRWPDRAKINVLESEIERITLSTNYIFIFRKVRKNIKLTLYDKDQKAQVFKFFTEYAKEKNIPLVNQDEQKH